MKFNNLDLQIHLETLRMADHGHAAPDAEEYMRAACLVAEQLAAGDPAVLNRLAHGHDISLRELAANSLFDQQGWLPDCGMSAAAHAMCVYSDVWRRVCTQAGN